MRTVRLRHDLATDRRGATGAAVPRGPAQSLRIVELAAVATLLGSCASYHPRPLVPEAELTKLRAITLDGLRIEHARPGLAEAGPIAFDPSDGLDEAELVGVALTLNPTLRSKRFKIGEAQALLITAGLWPNPQLGVAVRRGIEGPSGLAVEMDYFFGVLRPLLRPDERDALEGFAQAKLETTRAEIAAEELRLATEVKRARLSVLATEQVMQLLEQEATLRDNAVDLVRRQRELGEANEMKVVLVELDHATLQRALRDARADHDRLRRELNQLIGLPPTYELHLSESGRPLSFTLYDELGDEEVERRMLAGRFDLRSKAAEYDLAEQELRLAVAQQSPSLGIGPSVRTETNGDRSSGLAASVEIPIRARNQGAIAEKTAARERVRAEYVAALHDARARAFEALAALRRARAEVELQQRDVVPLIERTETLFEGALRARDLTIFEWLTVRARAVQARRDLLDALVRYASAAAELESATGMPLSRAPSPQEPKDDGRQ